MSCISRFAAVIVDNSAACALYERTGTSVLLGLITHSFGGLGVRVPTYPRGNSALAGRLIHNLGHNNIERLVETPPRRPQPLDSDVRLAPSSLEVLPVPVVDRMVEVEGSAVSEVEPRPQIPHGQTGYTPGGAA